MILRTIWTHYWTSNLMSNQNLSQLPTFIMKNMFGFSILLFTAFNCWWPILQTSTDPSQQFSAPFKAGNSRQVQTCYKPQNETQRKLQHFLVYTGTGEMGVLMTLKHWVSTQWHSQLICKCFHLTLHKLRHFHCNWVKQCHYHTLCILIKAQYCKAYISAKG